MGKKGGESTTTVELPNEVKQAAAENQQLVKNIAAIPYAPNFGLTTAAFTPQQQAAFAGTQSAANAFGMPVASGTGLPAAETHNGFSGYSSESLYNRSMQELPEATRQAIQRTLANPWGVNSAGSGGTGGRLSSSGGKSNVSDMLSQIR